MAVDTANKRFSLMAFGGWHGRVLPVPSGAFNTSAERAQLALSYAMAFYTNVFQSAWAVNSNRTIGINVEPE